MKKLLAVVLSAAMVLGMSTVAFAEDASVAAEPTLSVDGTTVYVNAEAGWNVLNETTITWDAEAVVESQGQITDFVVANTLQGMQGALMVNDTVAGQAILAGAFTNTSGAAVSYAGPIYYITFAEGTQVTVTMGAASVEVGAPAPTEVPTDAPATDAPATDAPATDAPATDAPATDAPTTSGAPATTKAPAAATKAPTTSTNKTEAAKTADVAPVATMAVLALAAAAVVVAMKKKVTE